MKLFETITLISDRARAQLGLPDLAEETDIHKSVETSGEVTDRYKLLASRAFNVEYSNVTDQMRKAVKSAMHYHSYS